MEILDQFWQCRSMSSGTLAFTPFAESAVSKAKKKEPNWSVVRVSKGGRMGSMSLAGLRNWVEFRANSSTMGVISSIVTFYLCLSLLQYTTTTQIRKCISCVCKLYRDNMCQRDFLGGSHPVPTGAAYGGRSGGVRRQGIPGQGPARHREVGQ